MRSLIAVLAVSSTLAFADPYYVDPYPVATYQPIQPIEVVTPQYNAAPTTTYEYDYQSGNSYTTTKQLDGSTRVNGTNISNGTMWNSTIDANGNMKGMDSNGDSWTYDRKTGNYMNTNGKICTGKGATRICNE